MPIAADYPVLDVFWTMILFFTWIIWIWMMVIILSDVFRRRDIGGWSKAAWTIFLIVAPFLGALIYLIAQHDGMAERRSEDIATANRQFDERVRAAAAAQGADGAAAEIEKAEQLLARGTITAQEFESLKAKALTAH